MHQTTCIYDTESASGPPGALFSFVQKNVQPTARDRPPSASSFRQDARFDNLSPWSAEQDLLFQYYKSYRPPSVSAAIHSRLAESFPRRVNRAPQDCASFDLSGPLTKETTPHPPPSRHPFLRPRCSREAATTPPPKKRTRRRIDIDIDTNRPGTLKLRHQAQHILTLGTRHLPLSLRAPPELICDIARQLQPLSRDSKSKPRRPRGTPTCTPTHTDKAARSDTTICARTASDTVMAEQATHNVVNTESSSGSPLVDEHNAHNQSTSATTGTANTSTTTTHSSRSDLLAPTKSANDHATPLAQAGSGAALDAAEPSAGDAANRVAHALGEKPGPAHGDLANGVHDEGDSHADDRSTADISVEMSANSDTDNSRADAAEKERSHHARTNSVKKPTAFSKVTATKSFMSKIAPTAPTAPKVGEKRKDATVLCATPRANELLASSPASASLLSSKPSPFWSFWVAKTGKSMLKPRVAGDGAGGPDASKVWNKNRPVQPAPPRQFTDEELKQQYGIHLATRLQSDENGKDSKWADIDDDEEDWAPETVVWMDGTKSSLTASDPPPPPAQAQKEQKPAPQQLLQKPADSAKPMLTMKRSERSGQPMQILKPGVAAAQAKQNGPSAAPSPGPEKKSLTAKSPAPAPPAKSPWAAVPKPDAVSPINIPVQQPPPRQPLPSQDARASEPMQTPPAREIAADTFDRSWREGEVGQRELFNSSNGRYEPAPERRGSMREPASRKLAVLQRPTQPGLSPAEPSAAFQSRTSAQMEGSWGRRRGSSVSQGSLPPNRRMSMNSRTELAGTPEIPQNDARSPTAARIEPVRPSFAQQSAWDQQMPARPADNQVSPAIEDQTPGEDPVKAQERIMREKRELAKKRRQEEEAAEEEAKRERLKAKLAALENAGKSKKERDAEAAAAAAAASSSKEAATAEKPAQPASSVAPSQPQPAKPAAASAATAPALEPQSMPSPPEQPLPARADKLPSPLPPKPQPASVPDRHLPSSEQQPKQAPIGTRPYQAGPAPYQASSSSYSSPGERKPQPFGRSPLANNDKFSPWPTSGSGGNVWGTSGIGNGTFESSIMPMSQQGSSLPPPPGMARGSNSARISPQAYGSEARSPNMSTHQVAEQQRAFAPPGMDSRPDSFPSQSRLNGVSPAPGAGRPAPSHPPGPIGPPSRTQQAQPPQPPHQDPISAWNSATTRLPQQYRADVEAAQQRRAQEAANPAPQQPHIEHTFKETFKKTSANQGRLGAPRRYESTEYTIHDGQGTRSVSTLSPAPPATQTQPQAPLPSMSPAQDRWARPSHVANPVRIPDGSQNPAHGGMSRQPPIGTQPATAYQGNVSAPPAPIAPATSSEEQSPPPPETESHPVNEGDAHHPQVRLPPPQAKVKLPPMSPSSQAAQLPQQNGSVMMPQRPYSGYAPPGAARPIVMNQAWQDRFNGLFNRTTVQAETPPSPPKTPPKAHGPALAVAAASRAPMDTQATGATVSLPQSQKAKSTYGFTIDNGKEIITKPTIDEMFNEELSFGSMPKVRVPRNVQYNCQPYGPTATNMLTLGPAPKFQKTVEAKSIDRDPYFWKNPQGIFVKIPGTRLNNKLCRHPESQQGQGVTDVGNRKPSYPAKSHQDRPAHERQNEDRRPSGRFHKSREHDNANDKPRDKVHDKVKGGKSNSAPESPRTATPAKESQPEPRKPSLAQIDRAVKEATGMSDGSSKARRNFKPRGARNASGNAAQTVVTRAPSYLLRPIATRSPSVLIQVLEEQHNGTVFLTFLWHKHEADAAAMIFIVANESLANAAHPFISSF
ncbi:uncharacterized protein MYCFIDRAFT_178813 [Pseudocercospora fijiensis CIRAD86]|uniref:Uncharacterized protein n=1 Tax=Pseudocercospora fijiensis (strain CIRAD86) TaxID=383855 RepID=M3A2T0_PSEFD|nr:uncharacterized protein MYCFIDRAFT_178813 [Pseudocercospora fijiensis CIRAD86]EME78701.1 hypothetical protein MYCFIDRAFT_178813 [Pseudocercospora fijiensis CIRAD86]